jgi:RNA polymerase sigma-70 factor (ECF subfamily)
MGVMDSPGMNQVRREDHSLARAARGGLRIASGGLDRSRPPIFLCSPKAGSRASVPAIVLGGISMSGIRHARPISEVGAVQCLLRGRSAAGGASRNRSSITSRIHDGNAAPYSQHRARLLKIACRMLGSRADAEDVLQDVYLRWHQSGTADIRSPLAFLITITTRLCLDRLRSLRQQRDPHGEPCFAGPAREDHVSSPELQLESRDRVSLAFLSVLESLGAEERAAFLLHDIFDYDYREVAQILARTQPSCRQLVHRARERLREGRPRFVVAAESRERVLEAFLSATKTGDRRSVMALLAEEVEYEAGDDARGRCGSALAGRSGVPAVPAASRGMSMGRQNALPGRSAQRPVPLGAS